MTSLNRVDSRAVTSRKQNAGLGTSSHNRQGFAAGGQSLPMLESDIPMDMPMEEESREELSQAMEAVADYVQNIAREINFSIDEEKEEYVVTVSDQETGEVIRQIPSQEMLELSKYLQEVKRKDSDQNLKGLLFQGNA